MASVDADLITPGLRARLAAMVLAAPGRVEGAQAGALRSRRRGIAQEFADHRPYVAGDDLRYLDWHLLGRLDELWTKVFEEERDRTVVLAVDTSASMASKMAWARSMAAAIGFVALLRGERVAVLGAADVVSQFAPPRRGRAQTPALFASLRALRASGKTDLAAALQGLPAMRGGGLGVLLTDALDPAGPDAAIRVLASRGLVPVVLHVLGPEELDPPFAGDADVVDSETGEQLSVRLDERTRARYRAFVGAWCEDTARRCRRQRARYVALDTRQAVDEAVLQSLRDAGVLR